MQFDARAAKALQPGQHITYEGYPGLRLTATASSRTWTYRYKSPVDDRMRQIKLGRWPAMSMPAAIVAWEERRTQREAGQDPAMEIRQARAQEVRAADQARAQRKADVRTVRQVCEYYLDNYIDLNRAPKGAAEIRRTFDTMLGDTADLDAEAVTRTIAFELIQKYAGTPVQASSLRRELGAAWDYALDAGKIPDTTPNWWRLIMRGKLKSKGKRIKGKNVGVGKRVLSADEVSTLLHWMPNFTPLNQDILALYLWTAVRGAEIVAIEGSEVTQESGGVWWWTIPKQKTKNKRHPEATDHRVPLYGRAKEIILRRKDLYGTGYLFPADSKIGHSAQKAAGVAVWYHQPACMLRPEHNRPRLPVANWAPHDLRRTSRTFLAALGCPGDIGEVITGHMLKGVEGTYNRHTYDAERLMWLGRLSGYLEELAARP